MWILVTASNRIRRLLPDAIAKRLIKNRPYWRDLPRRLDVIPVLERGHFVSEKIPDDDRKIIAFAQQNGFDLYYGYRIRVGEDIDQVDTTLMCVDEKGRVVEGDGTRLDRRYFYLGIRVPDQDISSMRYPANFERMEYVLRNVE